MTRHANIFSNFCIFAEVGMCWWFTFLPVVLKIWYRVIVIYVHYRVPVRWYLQAEQSLNCYILYNCSFLGRTPRRWWTGPTASATTSHATATTGSSAPDPTTGNASAVCTYAAPFLHRGLRRMCVWVILRYVYAGLLSSYIFMSATAASIITKSCVSHPNPFIICIQGPFWSVGIQNTSTDSDRGY